MLKSKCLSNSCTFANILILAEVHSVILHSVFVFDRRNLSEDNGDMVNLKKAALNITSRFGLLNTHRPLVVAISEERQAHETLLKLILARVNGMNVLLHVEC